MDRGACQATVMRLKELDTIEQLTLLLPALMLSLTWGCGRVIKNLLTSLDG